MKFDTAKNLVEKVFSSKYSRENYLDLISNIFKTYNRDVKSVLEKNDMFRSFINLGCYKDNKQKNIAIFEVELNKEKSINSARVSQRNLISKKLKQDKYDAAFVSFYHPKISEWRLSYVSYEVLIDFDTLKFKDQITPSRRQSFIAGPYEGSHTAKKQFIPLLVSDELPEYSDILKIFEIEAVNDDFYKQYKELYLKLTEYLEGFIKNDKIIAEDFRNKEVTANDFAKKTLGQFIFLYFLQRKGWIKNKKNKKELFSFSKLFENRDLYGENFFNDLIEPIFYEALGKGNSSNKYKVLNNFQFPYLNGGLFEPLRGYDWKKTDIVIPDSFFKNEELSKDGDIGSGLLDVFNRFNFTVHENDPIEQDIAVDPEMLGKVFENLLEITDRKSKGAYYTPREIVKYMCQETLISYLSNNLGETIPSNFIERFIRENSILHGNEIESTDLSPIIENAIDIDYFLSEIKVCDPAVGSGAFPMGMLNEIVGARLLLQQYLPFKNNIYNLKLHTIGHSLYGVDLDPSAVEIARLRFWLSLIVDEEKPTPLPNLEHKLMQGNSLLSKYNEIELFDDKYLNKIDNFKEDIKLIDNEISLLQKEFLVSSSSGKKVIKNRLNTLNKKKSTINSFYENTPINQNLFEDSDDKIKNLIDKLQIKIGRFLLPDQSEDKNILKQEIDNIKWELVEISQNDKQENSNIDLLRNKRVQPFFLWKLEFVDVFKNEGGFDIVIGNPPYIQLQKPISENNPKKYGDLFVNSKYQTFNKTGDIYALFYELGTYLLCKNGHLCLITSNKWMKAAYGHQLRDFLSKYKIKKFIDFAGCTVFENATVDVNILCLENSKGNFSTFATQFKGNFKKQTINSYVLKNQTKINDISSSSWSITDPTLQQIKNKIEQIGTSLMEWDLKINRGIVTGFNNAFIITEETRNKIINEDKKSIDLIKPVLRGRDINPYYAKFSNLFIICTFPSKKINIDEYPAIKKYLKSFGKKIFQTGETYIDDNGLKTKSRKKTNNKWFETQDQINYWGDFEKTKIIYPNMTKYKPFMLDKSNYYTNQKCFIVTGSNLKFLTGILNSWLFDFAFKEKFPELLGGTIELSKIFFEQLCIIKPNEKVSNIIEKIEKNVDNIAIIKSNDLNSDISELYDEIDDLVYKLYDLSETETELIKKSLRDK